jgi:aminoglycoside phosphotransferase (APT) family kinase protein
VDGATAGTGLSRSLKGLVDVSRLEAWLGDGLPGMGEPLKVSRVSTGASNEMFELRRGGGRWMLRRPPLHPVSPTAHDMAREHRVLSALDGTDVPHPRSLLLCQDPDVIGAPFHVMEFVEGFAPKEPLPSPFDQDPGVRREMGLRLVEGIAQLSRVDWHAAGLEGFGRPEGFLERQVARWLGQLERYRTREIPGLEFVSAWLEDHRPPAGVPGIVHGDYQFINVLFATEPPARLAAIVDWEQSTIGDPLLDLGWLLAGWQQVGEEPRFSSAYLTDRAGLPSRIELAERYAEVTGRSVERLDYYVTLSLFKLACVLEGSYHRFVTGKSDNPMHERMGPVVLRAARQAERTARTGEI